MTAKSPLPEAPSFEFSAPSDEQIRAAFSALKQASKNAKALDEAVIASLDTDFKEFISFLERCMAGLEPKDRTEYVEKAERAFYESMAAKRTVHSEGHTTQRGAIVTVAKYVFAAAALLSTTAAYAFLKSK
ncbi:hypothetical protein [Achromobacter insuavis]|uniref:hypothetical protein n=1 Tax=Achromobacter insuavis TaxID=1287735 RepID=UPI001F13AC16|nr:hypothetical protein [Achromobacter insuavis]